MRLTATFRNSNFDFHARFAGADTFNCSFMTTLEREIGDAYAGPYKVMPSKTETTLSTRKKVMLDDVVVNAIPYQEVGNLSGGKIVTIGG